MTATTETTGIWRYRTREGREVELVDLRSSALPGFVTGTRRDTGEEWTVAAGKLELKRQPGGAA